MTKGYQLSNKTDLIASFVEDEQIISAEPDTPKLEYETNKMVSQNKLRLSSQRFIQKFRRFTLSAISSKEEEPKPNETASSQSGSTSIAQQSSAAKPVDERQLKGILKTPNKPLSCSNLNDESCNHQSIEPNDEMSNATDTAEISKDTVNQTCAALNSAKVTKRVTFNKDVSKKKYRPKEPVSHVSKLSSWQQRKLKKIHRNDSLSLQATTLTHYKEDTPSESAECGSLNSSEDDLNGADN